MERSEPALVPEWLRNAGSVPGGGNSTHHSASSSSYSHAPSAAHLVKNRSSGRRSDLKSPCLSRSSSSSSWRNSSNGSAKHAYSNFNRHRDKDSSRDRDNSRYLDPWDSDSYDPVDSILHCREKDGWRHSQSMVNRKQVVSFSSKDLKKDGILSGPNKTGTGMHKSVFSEDFPSLGCGEKQGVSETSRALSPSLISAVQSLPIGNSVFLGGKGWSSALVEVPKVDGNSNTGPPSSPKTVGSVQTRMGDTGATHGLNMAEALAQMPSRARTPPQTQRLEELAVKQLRQLIPVTPSMAKVSVLGSSDKYKIKTAARSGEMSNAALRSIHTGQSPSGGTTKSDSFKTSQGGKLYVLKPYWENEVNPSQKNVSSNANGRSSSNDPVPVPQSITVPPDRASKNPSLNTVSGVMLEKKHSLSQTKSRNEFFRLIKQKSSANMSSDAVSAMEKHFVSKEAVGGGRQTPEDIVNSSEVANNGDAGNESNLCSESAWNPDDEEIAFLRSLGWEENHGEDEGLTEEEIDAFYNEYVKSKSTVKLCQGFLPTLTENRD